MIRDTRPEADVNGALVSDVRQGLSRRQKALPPKYFYDRAGSELFEEITRLPAYYLTRTERRLLDRWMPSLARRYAPQSLLELGAGSAEKTRIILRALRRTQPGLTYVPLDISAEFLEESAQRVSEEYPGLRVLPLVADLADAIVPPAGVPRPVLFAFLGSTIGNFERSEAAALLRRVRAAMLPGDLLLLGVDLHKDARRIERAYNDPEGVTAEFNRNVLRVLNRELGADFEVDAFRHHAPYVADRRRVEMHLVADREQTVTVPGVGRFRFAAGESIRTEICCKYDRAEIEDLFDGAGLVTDAWWEDSADPYALVVALPQVPSRGRTPRRAWPSRAMTDELERDTRQHLFAVGCGSADDRRVGAEVEVLLLDDSTRAPAEIDRSLQAVRMVARLEGWRECRSSKAAMSEFRTPQAGRLTFEPGGQLEYSAPPADSIDALARDLRATMGRLTGALAEVGIAAESLGIDPLNPLERTTLQLTAERYRRMDRHFARLGDFGARMMRQTAALQVCLDGGADPCARFELLQSLAPYMIAIFANSPLYAGRSTRHASFRAHAWRRLDPSRTGLVLDGGDPAIAYTRFALAAETILLGEATDAAASFGERLGLGEADLTDWPAHLTTLFPEVRPRGYLELRSCDAIAPQWYAAPLAFAAGIAYHEPSAAAAREVTAASDARLLQRAGQYALADAAMRSAVRDLWQLALDGCRALGPGFIGGEELERVTEFTRVYSDRGRSPADDVLDALHT